MGVVAPRMEEADRHRLHLLGLQPGNGGVERGAVERDLHMAVGADALAHRQAQAARHQRGRGRQAQVVAVGLEALAHLDHVAVALGGQHGHLRTLAFQQRVGRDRGAVDDAFRAREQVLQRQAQPIRQHAEAVDHALALVRGGGGRLGERRHAVRGDADHVGESAADVDADAIGAHRSPSSASRARAAGSRFSGGPHPPPPPARTCSTSPGASGMPTSLVLRSREVPSARFSV